MPLIVIEGVDASGKETQTARLYETLQAEGLQVNKVTFPDYESESSALVKLYLQGAFGAKPEDVNAYAASAFYAVDRYASYVRSWKEPLERGQVVIADRYVTSNLIHQGVKLKSASAKEAFLEWEQDFEYNKMGLPKPDLVLFLTLPPEVSLSLMRKREEKQKGTAHKDIHEQDEAYLRASYENACQIAAHCGWTSIECVDGENRLRSIDEIAKMVYAAVKQVIQ